MESSAAWLERIAMIERLEWDPVVGTMGFELIREHRGYHSAGWAIDLLQVFLRFQTRRSGLWWLTNLDTPAADVPEADRRLIVSTWRGFITRSGRRRHGGRAAS